MYIDIFIDTQIKLCLGKEIKEQRQKTSLNARIRESSTLLPVYNGKKKPRCVGNINVALPRA